MGKEGITYNVNSDGKISYVGFDEGTAIGITDLTEKWGLFIQPSLLNRVDPRSVYFNYSQREQEAQDMMLDGDWIEGEVPVLKFTAEEEERKNELLAVLSKAIKEFSAKFVLVPEMGEDDWKEWIKKAESLGCNELVKIHNDAQKRYNDVKVN